LGERLKTLFVFESRDSLGTRLEIEPQRPLHRDLSKPEVRRREYPADHDLFRLSVFRNHARLAVLESAEDVEDVQGAFARDLAAFVARLLRIGTQNDVASINCTLPRRSHANPEALRSCASGSCSPLPRSSACRLSTFSFEWASTQPRRRNTVSGRITS